MSKTHALVTLYNPSEKEFNNCRILSQQVDTVILCDNSQESHETVFQNEKNIIYITKNENLGLGAAFNVALKNDTYGWKDDDLIIFFDQDSQIGEDYIQALQDEYRKIETLIPNLGCLGPVFYNTSNGRTERPRQKKNITDETYEVSNTITSSLMMRYGNLKRIDFWNEKVFLDLADWDLCWRMQKAGMVCCMTEKVVLHHSVGNGEKKVGPIKLRVGQPFREYYQTRDALYLLQENYVPLKMRLRLIANVTIRPVVHYLMLDDKKSRMKFIRRGINDYKKGVHGEYGHQR
ncbi:MAG: glycosyltransferase [Faecalibacterium sp.]